MKRFPIVRQAVYGLAIAALLLASLPQAPAHAAAQLTARKATLGSSAVSPTSTTHKFDFTVATTGNVGSIKFQYCTTPSGTCTMPSGLVSTSATLSAQTGATGFSIVNSSNGAPYITRTASSISASTAVSYTLSGVTNPSTANSTFYIRITTYASTDTTGGSTDTGVVATSTASQLSVSASVDETLTFCTGTSGITSSSCAGATGSSVDLGSLSPSTTGSATSQIGVSTNATSGYVITVNGSTLTSGSDTIAALASQTASTINTNQFGLNLRDNATPNVGSDVAGAGTATATANYNTVDQYRFVSGDQIASKASADNFRLFTVSYIANIAGSTPAGSYATTMTYIVTPTF